MLKDIMIRTETLGLGQPPNLPAHPHQAILHTLEPIYSDNDGIAILLTPLTNQQITVDDVPISLCAGDSIELQVTVAVPFTTSDPNGRFHMQAVLPRGWGPKPGPPSTLSRLFHFLNPRKQKGGWT